MILEEVWATRGKRIVDELSDKTGIIYPIQISYEFMLFVMSHIYFLNNVI
mgnify:CR=1 FL=1